MREAVASFGGAVGLDQEAEAALEEVLDDAEGLTGALAAQVAAVRALEGIAAERRSAADAAAESTQQVLRAAQQHEERRITKVALRAEQAGLEAAATDQQARLDRLQRAERAARVAATLDGVREASDRADDSRGRARGGESRAGAVVAAARPGRVGGRGASTS